MDVMLCPKCRKGAVDETGRCADCGFEAAPAPRQPAEATSAETGPAPIGAIPLDYSEPSGSAEQELPAWRHELSRRLREIKKKREAGDPTALPEQPQLLPFPQPEPLHVESRAPVPEPVPRRRPPRPKPPPSEPRPLPTTPPYAQPAEAVVEAVAESKNPLRLVQPPLPSGLPDLRPADARQTQASPESAETIRYLIDNVTSRSVPMADPRPRIISSPLGSESASEGKLILLSRTLAGLVDVLVVVLCAGAFIIAADIFTGIDVLDVVSLVHYGILLLAVYLLYSIFFLGTAGQTIGMMITDLKVVQGEGERPAVGSLLLRCAIYVVALMALGIGVLWAVFDRESLSLHDRISGTRVARL